MEMYTRGYSASRSTVVGYKYEPAIDAEENRKAQIAKLDHEINCAEKITSLLQKWFMNCLEALGMLGLGLIGISLIYVVGLYIGLFA